MERGTGNPQQDLTSGGTEWPHVQSRGLADESMCTARVHSPPQSTSRFSRRTVRMALDYNFHNAVGRHVIDARRHWRGAQRCHSCVKTGYHWWPVWGGCCSFSTIPSALSLVVGASTGVYCMCVAVLNGIGLCAFFVGCIWKMGVCWLLRGELLVCVEAF